MKSKRALIQKARRPLLWGLAFFACSQVALALFMERGHPELIDPEYGTRLHLLRARRAESPGQPLVVVLGSSRTAMGFRPEALAAQATASGKQPVVFNYSLVGAGPLTQSLVLNRLLDEGIKPDTLLIEVWQPPLMYSEDGRIQRDRGLLGADLTLVSRYFAKPWPIYRQYARAQVLSGFVYRHQLQTEYLPLKLPKANNPGEYYWKALDHTGWLPYPVNHRTNGQYAGGLEKQQHDGFGPLVERFKLCLDGDKALREMLATCRARKINAALVVMPEASDFRAYYSVESLVAFNAYVKNLTRTQEVACIDARAWLADEDFCDGIHLVQDAASRFTQRFGREALMPLLEGKLAGVTTLGPDAGSLASASAQRPGSVD